MIGGFLMPVPNNNKEVDTVILPQKTSMALVNLMAADLIDAEGPLEVHKINTEIIAFSLKQDGMYEYNPRATYVIQEAFDILVAFEGDIVLYVLPEPETISRGSPL